MSIKDNKMYALFIKRENRRCAYYKPETWTERKVYTALGVVKGALKTKLQFADTIEYTAYELDFESMTIKEIEL